MKKFLQFTKQNLILWAIALVLLGIISYSLFTYFQSRQSEEEEQFIDPVLEYSQEEDFLDTDGDGIPDWEEKLWPELDYQNPDSDGDGVSDLDYINQKKREFEDTVNRAAGVDAKISESDRLGRSLYTAISAITSQGDISEEDRAAITANVADYIADINLAEKVYVSSDFYLVDNLKDNSLTYKKELDALAKEYPLRISEFELLLRAPSNPDAYLIEVQQTKLKYKEYLDKLTFMDVPIAISKQHIELTNVVAEIQGILSNLAEGSGDVDDVVILSSLVQAEELFVRARTVMNEMSIYFDILDEKDTFAAELNSI